MNAAYSIAILWIAHRVRDLGWSRVAGLNGGQQCHTLSYMGAVTIRLDPELQRQLDQVSRRLGLTRSEVVRQALRRQLALLRFEAARERLMPLAEARGYLTDEDVFKTVS